VTSEPDRARFEALHAAGLALASLSELPAILQRIVELACKVSDARYGALGVIGADRHLAQFVNLGMTEQEVAAIGRLPEGHGLLGLLIEEAHPVRIPRIAEHPRSVGFPPNHPPMTVFLGVPIVVQGEVFGNLYLTDKRDGAPFTAEDEEAVVALASQAGVAIENARLRAQMQRTAILEDRERIARDLHDDIVQSLFAEGLSLQAAMTESEDPRITQRLGQAIENLDRVIRDLRSYIFGLHRGDEPSLTGRIAEVASAYSGDPALEIDIRVDDRAFRASQHAQVIQIVREALSNAVRHAEARTIVVEISAEGSVAEIVVSDDGGGFDPDLPHGGHGLANLRARAKELGGALEIASTPDGTRVSVQVPR
jgi:signal transduction histidine kinase